MRARLQDGPKCGTEDSLVIGTGAGTGIARSWRVREGKEWTRSPAMIFENRPRRCGSRERSRRGSWGWISVQWRAYEPRRGTADLDEMAEDPVNLRRVGDDGENPHAVSTARTDEGALASAALRAARAGALGIGAVDLCDEAGPCGGGAPVLDGLGAPGVIPAIRRCLGQRREAQEVGAALPGGAVARPRGGSCAR